MSGETERRACDSRSYVSRSGRNALPSGLPSPHGSHTASMSQATFAGPSMSRSSRAQKKCWWFEVTMPSPSGSEYGERESEIQPAVWTMPVSLASNSIDASW